jgi:zinc/manganese transport system ATP-binding protein
VRVEQLGLRPGRCLGVFGPNGSGKSTLLGGIAGILKPLSGMVDRAPDVQLAYLPQLRTIDPSWPMTAFDAAAMPASSLSLWGRVGGRRRQAIRERLRALAVDDLARRPFRTLSGGQQQRVLLAGVLATRPDVLLLDEPTDGLDLQSRDRFVSALRAAKDVGLCVVLITHDPDELELLADDVAHLHPAPDPQHPSRVEMAQAFQPATSS